MTAKSRRTSKKTKLRKLDHKANESAASQMQKSGLIHTVARASRKRSQGFLRRRPHRSFRYTRRRDYKRSLRLPGYWSFTFYVLRILKQNAKIFTALAIIYAVVSLLVLGIGSQESFIEMRETVRDAGEQIFQGDWSQLMQASVLAVSTTLGGLSPQLTEVQQVYATLLGLMVWLTTVWLLRNILAGGKVRLRDGFYNSGAPILPTAIVSVVLVLQLLPVALAAIGYGAASSTGMLDGGVEAMLFWVVAGLLATLTVYWVSSTVFALVVVTLPGMYPMRALAISGDMVVGRRLRLLFRFLWLGLTVVVSWLLIMIPVILLDVWVKDIWPAIEWLPLVPAILLILGVLTLIWSASYIYLLYRKVVEDDAKPA